jgi:oligopeptidase B
MYAAGTRALLLATLVVSGCGGPAEPEDSVVTRAERPLSAADVPATPPRAEKRPHDVVAPHGATRADEYYWLRDDERDDRDMLAWLEAENAYADAALAPLSEQKAALYDELVGRIKQDDSSVPYRYKDYWYYTRYETGEEYPIHARRRGGMDAVEQVLLDGNTLAKGHEFYQIVDFELSPDQQRLAWLEDTVGRRQYTLHVKNLETGETLALAITGLASSLAWSADNGTIYYVENDPDTLLTKRIKAHRLGTDPAGDSVVYEEPDDAFYISVRNTRSEELICIDASSTVSSETRCTSAAAPGEFVVLAPRERDFEYDAEHLNGRWVFRTNWQAKNFRLMQVADDAIGDRQRWREIVAHDPGVFIDEFELFDGFIAIGEYSGGLTRIRLLHADGETEHVAVDEPAYSIEIGENAEPSSASLRYVYTSLTTPSSTYEVDVETGERRLLKETPVLGGFDKGNYLTERVYAPARDGTAIPVSLVYRRGFTKDGTAALLQYGYGSYGISMDPAFSGNIVSLLDRGVVYAIAHIRGGQEMGRLWYEDGKLLNKRNTFTDFIDVTAFLVEQGYAAPDRVAAMGGSAGGLLVGAVANMAPEKYRAIVSQVPFVDVVTTMLDPGIPLTTNEYDEWGNPEQKAFYDYMLGYSPYDGISAHDYPAIYVYTGLWDSQVQYWEPAKYVARLRERKTGDDLLVFRVEMEAGHGGQSGRFQRYREIAEQYAFLLNQLGVAP